MKKTSIGGQALLEGILMMGPQNIAIAVRKPDGEIIIDKKPAPEKKGAAKIPVIRGAVNMFRQMVIGVRALMYSADFIELEEEQDGEEPSKLDAFIEKLFKDKAKDMIIYFSVILSIVFSVGLFILLPNVIAGLFPFDRDTGTGVFFYNLIEGITRILIFFLYIYLASLLKDIKRVWEYHGAEHKTIHCYENGEDLTVENIRKYSTKHPRCGTSFLFLVMVIAILVFSILPWLEWYYNILLRLILIPLVAGLSYELLKFSGRHVDWPLIKVIIAPGLLFQLMTTKEPDDSQIEVAIAAMKEVLPMDGKGDEW